MAASRYDHQDKGRKSVGEFIEVQSPDGPFEAFLSLPAAEVAPAIVVLAEIYNVNAWVRGVCDLLAQAGFVALAPDLFWRQEARVHMDYTPENQQRGRKLAAELDVEKALADIDLVMDVLRRDPHTNGKVGVMGYCLGGQLAYRSAARSTPDACVVYYGTRLQDLVAEVDGIRCPTALHFGALDQSIPVSAAYAIAERSMGKSNVAVHVYEEAPHGFGRFGHPPFRIAAAELAYDRTIALMTDALGRAKG